MQAWRWAALLGLALLAPVGLPAGGAERRPMELRRRENSRDPLIPEAPMQLQTAPDRQAPVLRAVKAGQPLRLLHRWLASDGRSWYRVELDGQRGWLAG
ncbi:MAG: SH3 domain-containing protein [Cyanobacteriota bacterium]|nr:SH3 domain-containing protein [Cyanobacteriota bacterium]